MPISLQNPVTFTLVPHLVVVCNGTQSVLDLCPSSFKVLTWQNIKKKKRLNSRSDYIIQILNLTFLCFSDVHLTPKLTGRPLQLENVHSIFFNTV